MHETSPPQTQNQEELDARVRNFLEANRRHWRDMNVPQADGERLHDLVVGNGYTRAPESTPKLETEIVGGRSSGLSVSYKRGECG